MNFWPDIDEFIVKADFFSLDIIQSYFESRMPFLSKEKFYQTDNTLFICTNDCSVSVHIYSLPDKERLHYAKTLSSTPEHIHYIQINSCSNPVLESDAIYDIFQILFLQYPNTWWKDGSWNLLSLSERSVYLGNVKRKYKKYLEIEKNVYFLFLIQEIDSILNQPESIHELGSYFNLTEENRDEDKLTLYILDKITPEKRFPILLELGLQSKHPEVLTTFNNSCFKMAESLTETGSLNIPLTASDSVKSLFEKGIQSDDIWKKWSFACYGSFFLCPEFFIQWLLDPVKAEEFLLTANLSYISCTYPDEKIFQQLFDKWDEGYDLCLEESLFQGIERYCEVFTKHSQFLNKQKDNHKTEQALEMWKCASDEVYQKIAQLIK